MSNHIKYAIKEDLRLFFDRRDLYISQAKADGHCLIHAVQLCLNVQGFNIAYEQMKDLILNFAVNNWQNFIDTAYDEDEIFNPTTHSDLAKIDQRSDEFLVRQKEMFLSGIEEYVSEKTWNFALGDHIFAIVMAAFNLRIILFQFHDNAWTIQKMESSEDSCNQRRTIYLRSFSGHYDAVVYCASRIVIEKIKP